MARFIIGIIIILGLSVQSLFAYTETTTYQYDDLDRLTSARSARGMTQSFTFDNVHNRLSAYRAPGISNAPYAQDDSYRVLVNETLEVTDVWVEIAPSMQAASAEGPTSHELLGVLKNDTDPRRLTLSVNSHTNPEHGRLTLSPTGSFSYTPDADYVGPDRFTYQATNGVQNSNFAVVHITVVPIPSYPVARDDSITVAQGATVLIPVLENDVDIRAGELTVSAISYTGLGSVTNLGTGISYQAPDRFIGQETFRYTVTNGFGDSGAGQVTVTVTDQNFAPAVTNEVVWVKAGQSVTIPVLANDTDLDGDTLRITRISYTGAGTASHNGKTIRFTPSSGPAYEVIGYTVSDGQVTRTGRVTVYLVTNESPTARNDSFTTLEDTAITMNVLSNDTDPEGDPLTIQSTSGASHGSVAILGDQLYYIPARNYHGSDSFTYIIRDVQGLTNQATVDVTIIRDLTNDPPVAADDWFGTRINTARILNVLANDTDMDRDTLHIGSFTTHPVAGGTVSRSGNNLYFTPPAGFAGKVTFTYVVEDGRGGKDTGVVSVTVYKPENIIPILKLLLLDEEDEEDVQ